MQALQCIDSGSLVEVPADVQQHAMDVLNQLNADFAAARESELTAETASGRRCCCQ